MTQLLTSAERLIIDNAAKLSDVQRSLRDLRPKKGEASDRLASLEKDIKHYEGIQISLIQKLSPMRNADK